MNSGGPLVKFVYQVRGNLIMKFIKKLFKQKDSSKTLNDVISPEIKDDPFYDQLKNTQPTQL